ncbi:MAG: uracil-DNA glycosylase [Clostridia bacterium]|nr:uracil-DNA glycosylase [Clostridia bacterium]
MNWEEFESKAQSCHACGLSSGRTNVVIGRGSKNQGRILFVGEGPGENEDRQGLPFVGQAGRLLDLALGALEFSPDDYYIANVVKCRPPQNREPSEEECEMCLPLLRHQFILLKPRIVVCLGSVAARNLLSKDARITAVRGEWVRKGNTLFTATYHPAALLRDESKKADFYYDLKKVRDTAAEIFKTEN